METNQLWTTKQDDPAQLSIEGDPLMKAALEGLEAAPTKLSHLLSLPREKMLDELRRVVCLTMQAESNLLFEKGVREDLARERALADVLVPAVSDPPGSDQPEPSPDQLRRLREFRRWMLDQPPTYALTTIESDPET